MRIILLTLLQRAVWTKLCGHYCVQYYETQIKRYCIQCRHLLVQYSQCNLETYVFVPCMKCDGAATLLSNESLTNKTIFNFFFFCLKSNARCTMKQTHL